MEGDIHKVTKIGNFFIDYGRMWFTTIPPKETVVSPRPSPVTDHVICKEL